MPHLNDRYKKYVSVAAVLTVLNVLFFGLVNPFGQSTAVIFIGFGLLLADFYLLTLVILLASRRLMSRPQAHLRRKAVITSGVILVLIALESIGQLSFKDFLAVLVVCGVLYFYSSYYRLGIHRQPSR